MKNEDFFQGLSFLQMAGVENLKKLNYLKMLTFDPHFFKE
jgi:hypothetical protein